MSTEKVVPLTPYTPQALPLLPGGEGAYTRRELQAIKRTLDQILMMLPQAANVAPKGFLRDGMVRFSRSPWWPVAAQAADAWVFWDADDATPQWKYVRTN